MNIRKYQATDAKQLSDIWYQTSVIAHHFIDSRYWESQKQAMQERYLSEAETYVMEDNHQVIGFLSIKEDYLAALFVDASYQGKGYGKQLLQFIKERKDHLELKVYQKNQPTISFYLNNGFELKEETLDDNTMEKEFVMEWRAS